MGYFYKSLHIFYYLYAERGQVMLENINVNPQSFNEALGEPFVPPSPLETSSYQEATTPLANNITNNETPNEVSAYLIHLIKQKDSKIASLSNQVNRTEKQKKSTIYKVFCLS